MTLDALFASMGYTRPTIGVGHHVKKHQGEMYRGVAGPDAVGFWAYRRNRRRRKRRDSAALSLDEAAFDSMWCYGPGWTWELFDGAVQHERPRLYGFLHVRTDSYSSRQSQPVYDQRLTAAIHACKGIRPEVESVVCRPHWVYVEEVNGRLWGVHEVMLELLDPREELRFVSVLLSPDARLTVGAIVKALNAGY